MSASVCGDSRCSSAADVALLARSASGRSWRTVTCDAHRADSAAAIRDLPGFELVDVVPIEA